MTNPTGQQPQFVLRYDLPNWPYRVGGHVQFFDMNHPYEPLYEIVADPDQASPAAVLAHLYDRDTDQLWELRDIRTGRAVHSDLKLNRWWHAEEITVSGPEDALQLADEFGMNAHESGIPAIPELDANYVTAAALWPHIGEDLRTAWTSSWFGTSFQNPGVWEDVDWNTGFSGSRYAGMSAEQAFTAAAIDLEVAVKAALPRNLLPTPDSVRTFLYGDAAEQSESERVVDGAREIQPDLRQTDAISAARGPLTPPDALPPAAQGAENQGRTASEFPRAATFNEQRGQGRTH
jgi:hypothetical protein